MPVLQCYFDDSGATEAAGESVALGGGLGEEAGWGRLVEEWEPIIRDSGMGWFHATEWRSQENQLGGHWRQLIDIMNNRLIAYVGCVVPAHAVEMLKKWKADNREQETDVPAAWAREWAAFETDPLSVSLSWCLLYVSEITRAKRGGKVSLTFAKTDRLQARSDRLSAMMAMVEKARDDFGSKQLDGEPRALIQLQVADLVAYELTAYRHYPEVRWQYQMLRKKLRQHVADPPRLANLWGL